MLSQEATLTGWRQMMWFETVEHKDCAFAELSCANSPTDYITLDWKLAVALAGIVTGEPNTSFAVKKEALSNDVGGRSTGSLGDLSSVVDLSQV